METSNKKNALFGGLGSSFTESTENETLVASLPKTSPKNKAKSSKSMSKKETSELSPKKKTSLYLPPEKYKALKVLCAEMEVTVTTFIEDAVDAKMKSESRKRGKDAESHDSIES